MTYAIGHIIYGYDLTQSFFKVTHDLADALKEKFDSPEIADLDVESPEDLLEYIQEEYLKSAYRGCDPVPVWLGVKLGKIDECSSVDLTKIQIQPTDEQKQELEKQLQELPDWLQKIMKTFPVSTWIIWGSS